MDPTPNVVIFQNEKNNEKEKRQTEISGYRQSLKFPI